MVYIEIAAIIIFSIVSYLSLKKLLLAKFKKLDDDISFNEKLFVSFMLLPLVLVLVL